MQIIQTQTHLSLIYSTKIGFQNMLLSPVAKDVKLRW